MGNDDRAAARRRCLIACIALAISACGGAESDSSAEGSAGRAGIEASLQAKILVDQTAGKACDSDKDCGNGSCKQALPAFPSLSLDARSAPGGFCSFACGLNIDCGKGGICIGAGTNAFAFNDTEGKGLCLASCDASSPCREGYSCVDLFGQRVGSETAIASSTGSCQPTMATDEM